MGKVEQDAKIAEFKKAMSERNYEEAVQIADTLDIKHIRDNNLLTSVADAYELSKDYELAKQVLRFAYENTKAGRHLAYRLCLICVKNGEYEEAEEYYEDFVEMAPKDTSRYVLQYKIAESQNAPKEKLIKILEEYVNIDMEEKWAFELAKLYKEVGDTDKCVELCDEMGLWFSEGRYIKRAMELKKSITPLNITQQQLLEKADPEEEKEEKEEKKEEKKSEPHITKSPIESIMEKQPDRKPYEESKPNQIANEQIKPTINEKWEAPKPVVSKEPLTPTKRIIGDNNGNGLKTMFDTEKKEDYKPSFDITEIKVVDETNIKPDEILTAQPVEEGPQQMSFFNDDTPSNNKYEAPEAKEEPKSMFDVEKEEPKPQFNMETEAEAKPEEQEVPDVKDVEDMLKQLQERGILGADTVNKAVNLIDSDMVQIEEELKEEVENIMDEPDEEEPVTETEAPVEETPVQEEPEVEAPVVETKEPVTETETPEEEPTDPDSKYDLLNDGKHNTLHYGSKWESDSKSVIESEPVEAGVLDDFEPFEEPGLKEKFTEEIDANELQNQIEDFEHEEQDMEEIEREVEKAQTAEMQSTTGEVMAKPTEIIPDNKELAKEMKNGHQAAKVLDEAVPPKAEMPEDVPVFDLSGDISLSPPENKPQILKESNDNSAKIDMLSKQEETKKPEAKPVNANTSTQRVNFELNDDDMEVFGNYLNVEGLEKSIREVVSELIKKFAGKETNSTGNVIVMGDEKTGKTTMAIEIIKLVNKKTGRAHRKVAKIGADALNKKSFVKVLGKINGCDLIVENAHRLEASTITNMTNCLKDIDVNSIIILEAEIEPMEKVLASSNDLGQVFNQIIKIKQYNIREWVAYGSDYAKNQGYKLDEVAELALFKAIDDAFGAHKGIAKEDVEEIIEKAIDRNTRFGKKLSGLFGSKTDDEGLKLLDESDFNIDL